MYRQLIKGKVERDDLNTFGKSNKICIFATNPVNIYNYRYCKAKQMFQVDSKLHKWQTIKGCMNIISK
jgi:hypothetical protein